MQRIKSTVFSSKKKGGKEGELEIYLMGPMITRNDIEDVDDLSNSLEELVLTEIE